MRLPVLNYLYQRWLIKKIKDDYKDYVIINFDITAIHLSKKFNNVIYYCVDDFISLKRSKSFLVSKYWSYTEEIIARYSLFCIAVSHFLVDKIKYYNQNTYLLLTAASNLNSAISYKAINHKSPDIIYIGWLSKLNKNWVIKLAESKPTHTIHLVGPYKGSDLDMYKYNSNIKIHGPLFGDNLIDMILKCDICIAPYIQDRDSKMVYTMPNKFWLYLSFGKPIVSCSISNLDRSAKKFIYQADTFGHFLKNIDKSIEQNSIKLFNDRISYIRNNTWMNRVEDFIKICKEYSLK
jgi:hypothetical protein